MGPRLVVSLSSGGKKKHHARADYAGSWDTHTHRDACLRILDGEDILGSSRNCPLNTGRCQVAPMLGSIHPLYSGEGWFQNTHASLMSDMASSGKHLYSVVYCPEFANVLLLFGSEYLE